MKTMQEVQTLISDLQQFYTDVRLLDAAAIERMFKSRCSCSMHPCRHSYRVGPSH